MTTLQGHDVHRFFKSVQMLLLEQTEMHMCTHTSHKAVVIENVRVSYIILKVNVLL
jgi:hypothetical protein